jgi:hypothetical protein
MRCQQGAIRFTIRPRINDTRTHISLLLFPHGGEWLWYNLQRWFRLKDRDQPNFSM